MPRYWFCSCNFCRTNHGTSEVVAWFSRCLVFLTAAERTSRPNGSWSGLLHASIAAGVSRGDFYRDSKQMLKETMMNEPLVHLAHVDLAG